MSTNTDSILMFLSFIIDNEYFAVDIGKVLQVLQKQKITRVPNVTDDIKGVTNFRGEIIPVFDTRSRFGLPERGKDEKYVIVVMEVLINNNKSVIGAITDKVKDVITVDRKNIMPVPKMNNKHKEELITGVYKLKNDYILLLDVDKMFAQDAIPTESEDRYF